MTTPVEAVRMPDPYPYYAALVAERPLAYDERVGAWVACDAAAVGAVLRAGQLRVRPPEEPVPAGIRGTAAGEVFGDLVRMTDGDLQHRLKQVVSQALGEADAESAARTAAGHTRARLAEGLDTALLEDLMFSVPARTVATLCGLDRGRSAEAARLVGDFVQCIPASATPPQQAAAATAAARLQDLLGPALEKEEGGLLAALVAAARGHSWTRTAPLLANAVGFLSQTYDATAGLIGNTLLALARGERMPAAPDGADAFVAEVARHDAPVQNTRRFAAAPFRHGDAEILPGQQVLVVLAAANRDPAVNPDPARFWPDRPDPVVLTFGAGAHACPGRTLAVAVARAVVLELLAAGFDPAALPADPAYRPLANARIPVL